MYWPLCFVVLVVFALNCCNARIHKLEVSKDTRKYIALSTFGYYQGGLLEVKLYNFRATPEDTSAIFGFSLDRTLSDAMNPYLDSHQERCLLKDRKPEHDADFIYFTFDLKQKKMKVNCSEKIQTVVDLYTSRERPSHTFAALQQRTRRQTKNSKINGCNIQFDMVSETINGHTYYNTSFVMVVSSVAQEGLYNLYFHNCPNYEPNSEVTVDFTVEITEENNNNYLSAGEMPLPALYCMMSILFLLSGMFWIFILRQSRNPVFKIHYIMAVLVFLKAISLAFHGMNYHSIERNGFHMATWAVLFYVAHLLKGALLFVTLVLIGTGWMFIKSVLSPRDKRLFMAIIPLQVLANVAEIILEESEEGAREYYTWRYVFIFVDLLCCGCIMFPVVWSIRHLQEASGTTEKAAINLKKLKLFHHFYLMIVCYIYFTRMIVYLLRITVPFQYVWLNEMFKEMATYVFFVLTAYKFRPAAHNPYFALNTDDEDDEEVVLTTSGLTEVLTRVNVNKATPKPANMIEVTEEESNALLKQREGSHDYD